MERPLPPNRVIMTRSVPKPVHPYVKELESMSVVSFVQTDTEFFRVKQGKKVETTDALTPKSVENLLPLLESWSRIIFETKRDTTLAVNKIPWYETWLLTHYMVRKKALEKVVALFNVLIESEVPINFYVKIILTTAFENMFSTLQRLLCRSGTTVRFVTDLYRYCGSRDTAESLVQFLGYYLQTSSQHRGPALIYLNAASGEKYQDQEGLYYMAANRVKELLDKGVDPVDWIEAKMGMLLDDKWWKNRFNLKHVIEHRAQFDPKVKPKFIAPKKISGWGDVFKDLGLSEDTKLVDDYLPKGFWLARVHEAAGGSMEDITRIDGEGYYFTEDGKKHRGRRHYMLSNYHAVRCTPENYSEFRTSWGNQSLYNSYPERDELLQWGVHAHLWDANGNPQVSYVEAIKWPT